MLFERCLDGFPTSRLPRASLLPVLSQGSSRLAQWAGFQARVISDKPALGKVTEYRGRGSTKGLQVLAFTLPGQTNAKPMVGLVLSIYRGAIGRCPRNSTRH